MDRLHRRQSSGLTNSALRTWGMMCIALGAAGKCIIENKMLAIGHITNEQLLQLMQNSGMMALASLALVVQAISTCAAPVSCFLLTEGFARTGDLKKYMLRVLALALVSEIPFNLAMSGSWVDLSSRNPVFSMLLCLVLLYFFARYAERSVSNVLVKAVVVIAAFLWAAMLGIEEGACCLILTMVIWALRNKPMYRDFVGAVVAVLCSVFNPYYLAAPMGFLLIHFYNGEKGERSQIVNYAAYPVVLVLLWAIANFLL